MLPCQPKSFHPLCRYPQLVHFIHQPLSPTLHLQLYTFHVEVMRSFFVRMLCQLDKNESIVYRELLLSHNHLRVLPYELGKLFQLHVLGLQGNPLNKEIMTLYGESNGTHKLLTYMLDSLQGNCDLLLKVGACCLHVHTYVRSCKT